MSRRIRGRPQVPARTLFLGCTADEIAIGQDSESAGRPAFERLLLDLRRAQGDLEVLLDCPDPPHREEVEPLAHVVADWGLRVQEWLAEGERGGQ